jgi:hypothetical protein
MTWCDDAASRRIIVRCTCEPHKRPYRSERDEFRLNRHRFSLFVEHDLHAGVFLFLRE